MSEMELEIVVRFEVEPNAQSKDKNKSVVDYAKEWFQKEPDFVEDDYIEYDPDKNNGWTITQIDDKIFIDYMVTNEIDCYDIDQDITQSDLQTCALDFVYKFVKGNENNPIVKNQKLKVLYYYNGGCAGTSEVE